MVKINSLAHSRICKIYDVLKYEYLARPGLGIGLCWGEFTYYVPCHDLTVIEHSKIIHHPPPLRLQQVIIIIGEKTRIDPQTNTQTPTKTLNFPMLS